MGTPFVSNNVWPNYAKGNVAKASATNGQELGKDQFLSILITQLRNQDPLQPMQDKEFIAQMAQFTSLEQLMNISSQITDMRQSLGTASSLIGKKVSWLEFAQGSNSETVIKSGVVDSVLIRDGIHFAKVGKDEIALDYIVQIENLVPETNNPDPGGPVEPEAPSENPDNPAEQGDSPQESGTDNGGEA
ncbi:flagellar hook capping FlgD N-terminal domain-containing protein [Paenibacillus dakarensis]|uniref:flagellar hook capping FlgD N-terminal domain-containing protein n=1 Tax=Paenibacillus dakarensis TaxID=1527293 RepID=UPI0006D59AA2|nr:flagellar hook capping FlgD N-terminal domain-containing protein [Paenibacillus dakarensis]